MSSLQRQLNNFQGTFFLAFIKYSYNSLLSHLLIFILVILVQEYQNHLRGLHHVNAMRKLSFRLKQNLARMRVEQRIQQRLDEKNDEIRGVATGRTSYCHTCKLNYRQERTRHVESEMHKVIFTFFKLFIVCLCILSLNVVCGLPKWEEGEDLKFHCHLDV